MTPMRTLKKYAPEILSTGLALTVAFTPITASATGNHQQNSGKDNNPISLQGQGQGQGQEQEQYQGQGQGQYQDADAHATGIGIGGGGGTGIGLGGTGVGMGGASTVGDTTAKASVGDTKATAVTGDQKQTLVGGDQKQTVVTGDQKQTLVGGTQKVSTASNSAGGNVNYHVEAEKAVTLRVGIGTPTPAQLPSGPDLAGTMCYTVDTKTGWATPIVTTPGESHTKPNIECVRTVTEGNVQIERLRAASPVGVQLAARNCRVGVGAFYALLNTSSGDASSYCDVQPVAQPLPAPRKNRGTGKTNPKRDCHKELGGCKNELTDLKKANDALNYRIGQLEKGMAVPLPAAPVTPAQNPPAAPATPQ